MSMNYAERTGKIKYSNGLCDYTAGGILHFHKVGAIPVKIGYIEEYDRSTDEFVLKPANIFIQRDGVTKEGNHYCKQTIALEYRRDIYVEEERL